MYYCKNCGSDFEVPKKIYETHIFSDVPFEVFYVCPHCQSANYREKIQTHCRCCGGKLPEGAAEYCSDACRSKGQKLWKKEVKKLHHDLNDPLKIIVKECAKYNQEHSTKYSYGQYVALIKPTLKENKKCAKKKRTT